MEVRADLKIGTAGLATSSTIVAGVASTGATGFRRGSIA